MTSLNAKVLKQMFENGAKYIENNFEYIDELNVFPVPDGDTGTNLKITTGGAFDSIRDSNTTDISELTKNFARGLLMNARGNSGVIFSQIFKGFSSVFAVGQQEASIADLINAFAKAKDFAYRAVATPVEGTILTVIRVTAESLTAASGKFKDIGELLTFAHATAKEILAKTPDFLIQLKEVGVVDSGGYGLTVFLEGMKEAFLHPDAKPVEVKHEENKSNAINKNFVDNNEGFGYCSEFIMKIGSRVSTEQRQKIPFDEEKFKQEIQNMGNSFVYVRDDDIVKVHVHVIEPYKLLAFAAQYGEFNKIKIENMTLQFMMKNKNSSLEALEKNYNAGKEITDEIKVVATVPSEEMKKVYEQEFGITNCLNCARIGNPTIQQFYDLIQSARCKHVILVTDNGNVLMAAEQACKLVPKEMCTVDIIPCKDIASSYLSCLSFNPELELGDVVKNMNKTLKLTEAGKISRSVKNIKYRNFGIKIGDFIGVHNKEIVCSGRNQENVNRKLIDVLLDHRRKPKTAVIVYGKDATMEELNRMVKYMSERYLIKPIIVQGNQSTYHYYIGVCR